MKKPLLVYIQVNDIDGEIEFSIDSPHKKISKDGYYEIEFEHDVTKTSRIKISLTKNNGTQSHLVIKDVILEGIKLENFDSWAKYIVEGQSTPESSFGYMERPGYYLINIHQNALVHNFMAYFNAISKNIS